MKYIEQVAAVFLLSLCALALPLPLFATEPVDIEGQYILEFEEGAIERLKALAPALSDYSEEEIRAAVSAIAGFEKESDLPIINGEVAESDWIDFITAADLLDAGILKSIWPDREVSIRAAPDDSRWGDLWGLHGNYGVGVRDGIGGTGGAWEYTEGDEDIVVAVIDTGVDYNHPDLAANMWTNSGEIPNNGVDDDGNGYIDDIYGWNSITDAGNPMDDNEHGTHCAGTIAAVGNNDRGVIGVAPNVKIMALKFLGASGSGSLSNAIQVINYMVDAREDGVPVYVSSNSWAGGGTYSPLRNAITAAENAGISFVAAAGNANSNNDVYPVTPASETNASLIAVASIVSNGTRSGFSNYGKVSVDIGAPGSSILSTTPGNGYHYFSGTSMATPHVAGVMALIFSRDRSLTPLQAKAALMDESRYLSALNNKTVSNGIADAEAAVQSVNNTPPTLAPLADQEFSAVDTRADIALTASDPDGDALSCSAELVGSPTQGFWDFYNEYEPVCYSVTCEQGLYAPDTKRLYGSSGELFELRSDDAVYRTDGGSAQLIGTFAGAYADPALLTEPLGPPVSNEVTVSCDPTNLRIEWQNGFNGLFGVQVTITAGGSSVSQSFSASVTSDAPTLNEFADQEMAPGQTIELPVTASDDGELQIQVSLGTHYSAEAAALDQALQIAAEYPAFYNSDGNEEKWLLRNGGWLNLVPLTDADGDDFTALYDYDSSALLAVFPYSFYEDPSLLVHPDPNSELPVSVGYFNSKVTVAVPASYQNGAFEVIVQAVDETRAVTRSFDVTVSNAAPAVTYQGLYEISPATVEVQADFEASDADGDDLSIEVTAENAGGELSNAIATLGLRAKDSLSYNFTGSQEYYLYSDMHQQWYTVNPQDEACVLRKGSVTGNIVGLYPSSYCDSESGVRNRLLGEHQTSSAVPSAVLSSLGNDSYRAAIRPEGALLTRARLDISDGLIDLTRYIFVLNTNVSPTLGEVPAQYVRPDESLSLELSVSDPDEGQGVSNTVRVVPFDEAVTELDQEYDLVQYERCSGQDNCFDEDRDEWLIYSSRYRAVITLRKRNAACDLYINGTSLIGTVPLSYCARAHHLYSPGSGSSPDPLVSIESSGKTPQFTFIPNGSAGGIVTVETSDGFGSDSTSFLVFVSEATQFNEETGEWEAVADSDGDGVSDEEEDRLGTDKYDRGDYSRSLAGTAFAPWRHLPGSTLQAELVNTDQSSAASGSVFLKRHSGETVKEVSFTAEAGETTTVALLQANEGGEAQAGYLELSHNGSALTGNIVLSGDIEQSSTQMVESEVSLRSPYSGGSAVPWTRGFVDDGTVHCQLSQCNSRARLINAGSSEANFTAQVFDALGNSVASSTYSVAAGESIQLSDLALAAGDTFSGLLRVVPSDPRSRYVAYLDEEGINEEGRLQYLHSVWTEAGSGKSRELRLSAKEGSASLVNTYPETVSVEAKLYSLEGELLGEESYDIAPNSRVEFESDELIGEESTALLVIEVGERESITFHGSQTLSGGDFTAAHLVRAANEAREGDAVLDLWRSLIVRAAYEAPVEQIIDLKVRKKKGNVAGVLIGSDGRSVSGTVYLWKLRKKRGNKLIRTVQANAEGAFRLKKLKKGRYQILNNESEVLSKFRVKKKRRKKRR